jgi:hypothetical protein
MTIWLIVICFLQLTAIWPRGQSRLTTNVWEQAASQVGQKVASDVQLTICTEPSISALLGAGSTIRE